MIGPVMVADPPPGWVAADVARPVLSDDVNATVSQWTATRDPHGSATLLAGCLAAPIATWGWVEDMRTPIANRAIGTMAATSQRITDVPMEAKPDGSVFVLRAAGAPADAPVLGAARTYLGFDTSRVWSCFVICATKPGETSAPLACDASVRSAHLDGSSDPPPAGVPLRTVTWAVHHPAATAASGAALLGLGSVLAVARRRRPRTRINA
jgi:hypothetical protein